MNKVFHELLGVITDHAPRIPLEWHTNGILLKQKVAERVLRASDEHENHRVYVSIDGGNRKSHELNRGQGTFDKTLDGLETLLAERGKSRKVQIGVYQLDLGVNEREYDPRFLELAKRVDIWARVAPVHTGGVEPPRTKISAGNEIISSGRSVNEVPPGPCFWAGNSLCVAPDGSVSVCLLSHISSGVIGNLLQESAETVLNRASEFRSRLSTIGRQHVPHCASCYKPCGEADVDLSEPPMVQI